MNLNYIYTRIVGLITKPVSELRTALSEDLKITEINKKYLVPLSLFVAICAFIGAGITNIKSPIDSFIFILINAAIVFSMMFSQAYLSGKMIQYLAKNMDEENHYKYYFLNLYSQTALFVILAFVKIFPSLILFIVLSLYGGYIFYSGIPAISKLTENKRLQLTLLSSLIMIVTFIATSELFTILYSEIIELF